MGKIDYKALLEEWKRQRAELDMMISYAERQLGVPQGARSDLKGVSLEGPDLKIEPDTFHGLNILQASERYLGLVGRPARSTEDIAEALGRGGVETTPASVATILGRDRSGTIQRVKRGLWGLSEWYKTS
jgi:hypothetical protein